MPRRVRCGCVLCRAILGAVLLALLPGCFSQQLVHREFYEPTEVTLLERQDGTKVGAVKSETLKSGAPDWSDQKDISLISIGK